jgi:hypothetical protein
MYATIYVKGRSRSSSVGLRYWAAQPDDIDDVKRGVELAVTAAGSRWRRQPEQQTGSCNRAGPQCAQPAPRGHR